MLDNDRSEKKPSPARGHFFGKWIDGLGKAEKLVTALVALVLAVGALGTGVYYARHTWMEIFRIPANGGSPTSSSAPTSPISSSPTGTASPAPLPTSVSFGSAQISSVTSAAGGSCIGDTVDVAVNVFSPASANRELWLMAVVMTGTPIHPVYYAKHKIANSAGSHRVNIQFIGAPVGSVRNLVMVSSAQKSLKWLQDNLANDGNPGWDIHRVGLPSDVNEI